MTSGAALRIPAQRPTEQPCPPYCSEDHHGEPPGMRSHWGIGASVHLPDGTVLLADVNARDGMPAEVVLHDSDGHERRLPPSDAIAYGQAIIAAAYATGQAVSR